MLIIAQSAASHIKTPLIFPVNFNTEFVEFAVE